MNANSGTIFFKLFRAIAAKIAGYFFPWQHLNTLKTTQPWGKRRPMAVLREGSTKSYRKVLTQPIYCSVHTKTTSKSGKT
jgi:hypothetical protein